MSMNEAVGICVVAPPPPPPPLLLRGCDWAKSGDSWGKPWLDVLLEIYEAGCGLAAYQCSVSFSQPSIRKLTIWERSSISKSKFRMTPCSFHCLGLFPPFLVGKCTVGFSLCPLSTPKQTNPIWRCSEKTRSAPKQIRPTSPYSEHAQTNSPDLTAIGGRGVRPNKLMLRSGALGTPKQITPFWRCSGGAELAQPK